MSFFNRGIDYFPSDLLFWIILSFNWHLSVSHLLSTANSGLSEDRLINSIVKIVKRAVSYQSGELYASK